MDGQLSFATLDYAGKKKRTKRDGDFSPGRGGLLQLLGMSLPPCCRFHPAEIEMPRRSDFGIPCCLRPSVAGSALGSTHFRGHLRVHFRYGPVTRDPPRETLSIGFRVLVARHPAIQATGLLTVAPAGLSPAEHASLAGRTTGHEDFPHPALGQDFT